MMLYPFIFFSCLIVGSKNSGKSYAMTSLLKMFEENPIYDIRGNQLEQRIILFSPTALNESNIEFKNLKNLSTDDIHLEYTDEILEEILIDIKQHIDQVNEYEKYLKALDKFNNSDEELNDDEYWLLFNNNFLPILEKRHIITHICFDDLIGDKQVFKKSRDGGLFKFLIKHNIDIFCLFKYANLNDILKKFYPSVSGIMNEDQFKEMYLHSSKEKFNFLTIISHNALKGRLLIRKNWNINLKLT